jgi:acyl carrier protein
MSAGRTTQARAALLRELVEWLNERFAPEGPRIHADTLLFVGGLLDSMRILELIAWTERAIGREIPDGDIRTDNFASAARIAELFADRGIHAHR